MKSATTVFQVERFKRLLRAHWAEQRRSYALFWLIVASLHALLMLILLAANHGKGGQTEVQAIVFWCGLIASGAVLSGLHFSALRKPGAALILLTRPATALEKWLLAVLFVLIVWPLAYAISATVIHLFASIIGYQWHTAYNMAEGYASLPKKQDYSLFIPLLKRPNFSPLWQIATLMIYTGITGFVLLGSLYFRKNAIIKTAVTAFVLFLITLLLAFVTDAAIGIGIKPEYLAWWHVYKEPEHTSFRIWLANSLFWLAVPLLVWACALLALREKDLA